MAAREWFVFLTDHLGPSRLGRYRELTCSLVSCRGTGGGRSQRDGSLASLVWC